jgi:hypothetical protein
LPVILLDVSDDEESVDMALVLAVICICKAVSYVSTYVFVAFAFTELHIASTATSVAFDKLVKSVRSYVVTVESAFAARVVSSAVKLVSKVVTRVDRVEFYVST